MSQHLIAEMMDTFEVGALTELTSRKFSGFSEIVSQHIEIAAHTKVSGDKKTYLVGVPFIFTDALSNQDELIEDLRFSLCVSLNEEAGDKATILDGFINPDEFAGSVLPYQSRNVLHILEERMGNMIPKVPMSAVQKEFLISEPIINRAIAVLAVQSTGPIEVILNKLSKHIMMCITTRSRQDQYVCQVPPALLHRAAITQLRVYAQCALLPSIDAYMRLTSQPLYVEMVDAGPDILLNFKSSTGCSISRVRLVYDNNAKNILEQVKLRCTGWSVGPAVIAHEQHDTAPLMHYH